MWWVWSKRVSDGMNGVGKMDWLHRRCVYVLSLKR